MASRERERQEFCSADSGRSRSRLATVSVISARAPPVNRLGCLSPKGGAPKMPVEGWGKGSFPLQSRFTSGGSVMLPQHERTPGRFLFRLLGAVLAAAPV